jgi:hypothetical protein
MMASTPIGGASLSGGMGAGTRGGMRMDSRAGGRPLVPFGYEGGIGIGMSGGMTAAPMSRQAGMRRSASGPGFGYPFRMPPGLGGTSSGMAMP